MKKIAFKASVFALSTALAVTPMAFAQTPVSQSVGVAAADTQPLPGAKKSSAVLAAALGVSVAAATAIVVGLVVAGAITASQANNTDDSATIAAIIAAAGTTGTTGTR